MKRDRDVRLIEAWQKMPAKRRLLYIYTLLTLLALVLGNLDENLATLKRLGPGAKTPPPSPSQEVEPAPVNL